MSLLGLLLVVVAFVAYCFLVSLGQRHMAGVPAWVFTLAYALGALIVVLYLCRAFGVFGLLSSVRV